MVTTSAPSDNSTGASAGPLGGLVVIDLTRVLSGPFATMMLADLGARVIKVERPGVGDDSRSFGPFVGDRSLYFARVNRGKESIALDLTADADREVLLGMLRAADVVVENFRPGVMDRLGLGAERLTALNPRLVQVSISGFGQTGPLRERPAYDAVVQGMSGIMAITGSADGPPVKPGSPVADLSAGLYAFGAICAALVGRSITGRGTVVDIAMLDSTVSLLESPALHFLAHGVVPPRAGNAHYSIAPFDTFATADRPITICAANDHLFARLGAALGLDALATDPRFVSNADRHTHRAELTAVLTSTLAPHGSAHWLAVLGAAGVPCGPVSEVGEALTSEQAQVRQMVVDAAGLPVPGNPVKLRDWPDLGTRRAEPRLDEHGADLRAEFGPVGGAAGT